MTAVETEHRSRGPWQWAKFTNVATKQTIPALLWTLHDLGGEIEDSSGRATRQLTDMATKRGMPVNRSTNVNQLVGHLDNGRYAGCVSRLTNGKRTLKIRLLLTPEEMPPRPTPLRVRSVQPAELSAPQEDDDPEPEPVVVPLPDDPEPEPEPEVIEVDDDDVEEIDDVVTTLVPLAAVASDEIVDTILTMSQLCTQLLLGVSSLGQPAPSTTDEQARERHAVTLAENERLRRKVNDVQETLVAKTREIEQLRKSLTITNANYKALQDNRANGQGREQNLARLNGTQKAIAAIPTRRG